MLRCRERPGRRGTRGNVVVALEDGEHYWFDLVGAVVGDRRGVELGRVVRLMETGANDVLVVAGADWAQRGDAEDRSAG